MYDLNSMEFLKINIGLLFHNLQSVEVGPKLFEPQHADVCQLFFDCVNDGFIKCILCQQTVAAKHDSIVVSNY